MLRRQDFCSLLLRAPCGSGWRFTDERQRGCCREHVEATSWFAARQEQRFVPGRGWHSQLSRGQPPGDSHGTHFSARRFFGRRPSPHFPKSDRVLRTLTSVLRDCPAAAGQGGCREHARSSPGGRRHAVPRRPCEDHTGCPVGPRSARPTRDGAGLPAGRVAPGGRASGASCLARLLTVLLCSRCGRAVGVSEEGKEEPMALAGRAGPRPHRPYPQVSADV